MIRACERRYLQVYSDCHHWQLSGRWPRRYNTAAFAGGRGEVLAYWRVFIWPTFPPLAKRIGLPGSTSFLIIADGLAEGQARELPLADYIAGCYRMYGSLQKDALRVGDVAKACDRLGAFVVR